MYVNGGTQNDKPINKNSDFDTANSWYIPHPYWNRHGVYPIQR